MFNDLLKDSGESLLNTLFLSKTRYQAMHLVKYRFYKSIKRLVKYARNTLIFNVQGHFLCVCM